MSLHINTPYIKSDLHHQQVWLKMDVLQVPGSFKIRGIGYACQQYAQQGTKRFVASSGGNAGIAVAYAAQVLNIPALIVVPQTTTPHAISLVKSYGAEVVVHGKAWHEANQLAQSLLTPTDAFIHPFDHPWLWKGHASLIDEIATSNKKPQAIALAVGGGGLLAGVALGLQQHGWEDIPIIAVETEGTASLHQSIQQTKHIELKEVSGIATSLGARMVCEQAWKTTQMHTIKSIVVSDKEAVNACLDFHKTYDLVIEPACGAVISAIKHQDILEKFPEITIIVCGGKVATLEQLHQWKSALN